MRVFSSSSVVFLLSISTFRFHYLPIYFRLLLTFGLIFFSYFSFIFVLLQVPLFGFLLCILLVSASTFTRTLSSLV
jgi:hypothetical protein